MEMALAPSSPMPFTPVVASSMPLASGRLTNSRSIRKDDAGELLSALEGKASETQRQSETNGRLESGSDGGKKKTALDVCGNGSEIEEKDGNCDGCRLYVGDLSQEVFDQDLRVRENGDIVASLCHCGKPAIMKIAGRNSENRGLRYLSCEAFTFFAKKRKLKHCKFFQWVDPPRASREEVREHKKEARAIKRQKLEIRTQTREQQIQIRTRAAARYEKEQTAEVPQAIPDAVQDDADGSEDKDGTNTGLCTATMRVMLPSVTGEACKAKPQVIEPNSMDQAYHGSMETKDVQKDCSFHKTDEMNMQIDRNNETRQEGGTELSVNSGEGLLEAPICMCSQKAIMKAVKSRGPNKGLRYLICPNARPLFSKGKRPKSCKFFMWVDTPEQKKEERKQKKEENK
eukprot:c26008_g1_i1 orf=98-1300(+)